MSGMKLPATTSDTTSLTELLRQNALRFGTKKAALRVKSRGIWQETSWAEYYEQVQLFSLGLVACGLGKGDTVAVIGNNGPTSLYTILATEAAGGIPAVLHHDATSAEVKTFISKFNIQYLVAEDQEQVDKVLEGGLPPGALKKVIFSNPRGMRGYREEILLSAQQLCAAGAVLKERQPDEFAAMCATVCGSDTAIICTTSGSSGEPQGAMLSHSSLISMAAALAETAGIKESDEFVSFLPLAWFGEAMISLATALLKGFTVNFPESRDTLMADLREIGPHIIFAPPQIWEGIAATVQVKMMESTPFKRFMYNSFMPIGERIAATRLAGKPA
jgi:long-chain acyl-CoA synthetase